MLCQRRAHPLVGHKERSVPMIRIFAGSSPDEAVVEPAARALLADYDKHVEHFEVVA